MPSKHRFVFPKALLPQSFTPILVTLLIIESFIIGVLYTKVQYLEKAGATPTAGTSPLQPTITKPAQKVNVAVGHFPVKGKADAKVTIIEFADFRCPFCEQVFTQVVPQIIKEYVDTGKAKFAFRHYAFLGAASTIAANAAECAQEQGKFWDMHDYLYKNQPPETDTSMYTTAKLTAAAGSLSMNTTKFSNCLSQNKYTKNVTDDMSAGSQAGVNATPTFFINGTPLIGAQPYSAFKAAIDAELK